jgi:hypothetical protein
MDLLMKISLSYLENLSSPPILLEFVLLKVVDFKHLGDQTHREKNCYMASEFIALSLLVGIC